jgi:hypothetical protein
MRARCGGHIQQLVMSRTCACLSLPRSTRFCSDFPKAVSLLGNRMASTLPQLVLAATNKITLGYLNSNLMAPKTQPPTVIFDRILLRPTMCLCLVIAAL